MRSFSPSLTVSITSSTSNARAALPKGGSTVLVTNKSGNLAFVQFGDSTVTATVPTTGGQSFPVLNGASIYVAVDPYATHVATILESGASGGPVFVTPGETA